MGLIPHGVCNIIEDQFARLLWAHLKLSPRTSIVSSHLGQGTAYIGGGEARGGSSSCMGGGSSSVRPDGSTKFTGSPCAYVYLRKSIVSGWRNRLSAGEYARALRWIRPLLSFSPPMKPSSDVFASFS